MEVKEQLQRLTSREWQSWDVNKDLTSKSVHSPLNHEDHRKRYLRNPTDVGWPFQTANPEFPWEFLIFYAKSWSCQFCSIAQHTDRKCHLTSLSVKQTFRTAICPNSCYCSRIYHSTVLLINGKACSQNVTAGL